MLGRGCLGQSCRTQCAIGFVPRDAGAAVATPGSVSGYPRPSGAWGHMNLGKKCAHTPIFLADVKEKTP